jgi:hypothetical protein
LAFLSSSEYKESENRPFLEGVQYIKKCTAVKKRTKTSHFSINQAHTQKEGQKGRVLGDDRLMIAKPFNQQNKMLT